MYVLAYTTGPYAGVGVAFAMVLGDRVGGGGVGAQLHCGSLSSSLYSHRPTSVSQHLDAQACVRPTNSLTKHQLATGSTASGFPSESRIS